MTTHTQDTQKFILAGDLLKEIFYAESQAINGPFYPEKGITKDSLLKYAREIRAQRDALLSGNISINQFIKS